MRYIHYLILFITIILPTKTALAEEQRYRIELLLLRHLDGVSELERVDQLTDFSESLDLTPPPEDDPLLDEDNPQMSVVAVSAESKSPDKEIRPDESTAVSADKEISENADELEDALLPEEEPEPVAVLIEGLSDNMQQAWRRLRSSAAFRPELQLSWEQAEHEPFPLIRFHDSDILLENDPYAELRTKLESIQVEIVPIFTDTNTSQDVINGTLDNERLIPESPDGETGDQDLIDCEEPLTSVAALRALMDDTDSQDDNSDELNAEEATILETACRPVIPDSTLFYRVDGTARLRKTRFLHLDLEIEYREAIYETEASSPRLVSSEPEVDLKPRPSSFLVHRIKQSRQVQTEDMEYFDGPVLGILALITRIDAIPEAEADDASASQ